MTTGSRLKGASVHGIPMVFNFDDFGNMTSYVTDGTTTSFSIDPSTNRIDAPGTATYDAAGNTISLSGITFEYDELNQLTHREPDSGPNDDSLWAALYTADDERLAVLDAAGAIYQERWTLRDLGGRVLSQYLYNVSSGELLFEDGFETGDTCEWSASVGGSTCLMAPLTTSAWFWAKDYVYREGQLLVEIDGGEILHLHLDHLGSLRQVTNSEREVVEDHDFLPFGQEVTTPGTETMLFTGHERDHHTSTDIDDLDYMHARYYSPNVGRFLSVDPVMDVRGTVRRPQAWNRYTYAINNPLKYVDPTGQVFVLSGCAGGDQSKCSKQAMLLYSTLGKEASQFISLNTKTGVVSLRGISARAFGERFGEFAQGLGTLIGSQDTFSLVTDSGRASSTGGGLFDPGRKGGGTILIETGMFPRQTGDVTGTARTALVHETGHAMRSVFPDFFGRANAQLVGRSFVLALKGEGYAVNFENRYRRDRGLGIRYTYDPNYPDVLVDFNVSLFPED